MSLDKEEDFAVHVDNGEANAVDKVQEHALLLGGGEKLSSLQRPEPFDGFITKLSESEDGSPKARGGGDRREAAEETSAPVLVQQMQGTRTGEVYGVQSPEKVSVCRYAAGGRRGRS